MSDNVLDLAAARFSNMVGQDLDLSKYMEESIEHRVKPAGYYRDELIKLLIGENENERGDQLPFSGATNKFEFRKHEMTVWTGFKGHGKSALISQAFTTWMGRSKKTFVISPEFRPARVLERKLYQRLMSREPTADDVTEFIEWANIRLWLYDVQSSLSPNDVIALCRYATQELGAEHILIDSLMKCGIGTDDWNGQKRFVDKIQNVCHKDPVHIHLVAHARKGNDDEKPARLHDIKGGSEIADMVENVLSIWRNKPKEKEPNNHPGEPDAMFVVEAQRNAEGWVGQVPLSYDPKSMIFYAFGETKPEPDYVRF